MVIQKNHKKPASKNPNKPDKSPSSLKPNSRPKGAITPILKRLWGYLLPYSKPLFITLTAALLTSLIELSPPWVIRLTIDHFILGNENHMVWWAAFGLIIIALFQGGIDFLRLYLTAYTGQKIVFNLRNDLFEHINKLSFSFFDEARTGDLMSRITTDIDILNNFFGRAAVIVITNIMTLIGILIVLSLWSWQLALIYVGLIPFILLGMWAYARKVRPAWKRVQQHLARLTESIQETLTGIQVIKVFGRENYENERFKTKNSAVKSANLDTSQISALWMPFANIIIGVGTGMVIWIGGRNIITGLMSLGILVGFTTYMQMLLRPIRQTGMMINLVMQSIAAAERVFDILDIQSDVHDTPDAYALPPIDGKVEFENVYFAYQKPDVELQALHNISFCAQPGEIIALVGPSGAGKTTLAHLLCRFYDAQEGKILIDGHPITNVTLESLRNAIGIAFQSVFLFDASIGENIAYGNPNAKQSEISAAAKVAQIHKFIEKLPMGYQTPVGERGVRLSGGQKQRIALARVLLKNPKLLILDEPTSSLDVETERQMRQALKSILPGRTTFIIAHRLWTVQQADQILVIDKGQIVEQAHTSTEQSAHRALIEKGGLYATLYNSQIHPIDQPNMRQNPQEVAL